MGLLDRLNLLVRSNVNSLLGRDETGSSPERRELDATLSEARARVGLLQRDERRLESELDASRREEDLWEERAATALRRHDEPAAREALLQRNRVAMRTERLLKELAQQRAQLGDLLVGLDALGAKIEAAKLRAPSPARGEAVGAPSAPVPLPTSGVAASPPVPVDSEHRRWEALAARRSLEVPTSPSPLAAPTAPSEATASQSPAARASLTEAADAFDRFEGKVAALEAEVAAAQELSPVVDDDPLYDPKLAELERRFRELEAKSAQRK